MITGSYETELLKSGKILITFKGISMLPILRQDKDLIQIELPKREYKKNDCVLFRKNDGQLVMHRIIKIYADNTGKLFDMRGDNCYTAEEGMKESQILGIMTGFYRGKKFIDVDKNILYKTYVVFRKPIYYLRHLPKAAKRRIKKLFGR